MDLNSLSDGLTFEIHLYSNCPRHFQLLQNYYMWNHKICQKCSFCGLLGGTEEMFIIFGVAWNPRCMVVLDDWTWHYFVIQKIASRLCRKVPLGILELYCQKLQCTIVSSCDPKGHVRYYNYLSSVIVVVRVVICKLLHFNLLLWSHW
jgi:hypothetical protein